MSAHGSDRRALPDKATHLKTVFHVEQGSPELFFGKALWDSDLAARN